MTLSFLRLLAIVGALLLSGGIYIADAADKPLTKADVEAIAKKVIEDNPELIMKSVESYQLKQQAANLSKAAQNITALQGDINNNPNSPSAGNPSGDVTVVEFFDYHCGYCKHFFPAVSKIMETDKGVRVVFKELPILSEDSATAAKAALGVYSLDKSKYFAFHTALMNASGAFTLDMLNEKAKELGISADDLKKAMEKPEVEKEIAHNKELAQSLSIAGTPAIIIGSQLIPGAIDFDMLKSKIAMARQGVKEKK